MLAGHLIKYGIYLIQYKYIFFWYVSLAIFSKEKFKVLNELHIIHVDVFKLKTLVCLKEAIYY